MNVALLGRRCGAADVLAGAGTRPCVGVDAEAGASAGAIPTTAIGPTGIAEILDVAVGVWAGGGVDATG